MIVRVWYELYALSTCICLPVETAIRVVAGMRSGRAKQQNEEKRRKKER